MYIQLSLPNVTFIGAVSTSHQTSVVNG